MFIYGAFDNVSKKFYTTFLAETDEAGVRDNLLFLTRMKPMSDISFVNFGSFDLSTGKISTESIKGSDDELIEFPHIVKFDGYQHFDEQVLEDCNKTDAQRQVELENLRKKILIEKAEAELEEQKLKVQKARQELDN